MFSISEKKSFILENMDQWTQSEGTAKFWCTQQQIEQAKRYLEQLPSKSVYNWYIGLMATEDKNKRQFLESWLEWCARFLNNPYSCQVLTDLFLDHYPWNSLYTPKWNKVALTVKQLSESTTPGDLTLLSWAKAFFSPIAVLQIQPEIWETCCQNWLDFYDIVRPNAVLLSRVPMHSISFTIGSDYLSRCVLYLRQSWLSGSHNELHRKAQLQLLDNFPSQVILDNIMISGYRGPIANRLISRGVVPQVTITLETIRRKQHQLNLSS